MLVVTRKKDQCVKISDGENDIIVVITNVNPRSASIGIVADKKFDITRHSFDYDKECAGEQEGKKK